MEKTICFVALFVVSVMNIINHWTVWISLGIGDTVMMCIIKMLRSWSLKRKISSAANCYLLWTSMQVSIITATSVSVLRVNTAHFRCTIHSDAFVQTNKKWNLVNRLEWNFNWIVHGKRLVNYFVIKIFLIDTIRWFYCPLNKEY